VQTANSEDWQGVPLSDMTDAQRASYWQHYARKHENTVKGFEGMTPQQVAELKSEVESLKSEKLTADEKALKQATKEAADAARAEAEAKYRPQMQALQVKAIASTILAGDQLSSFCDIVNPNALLGADGEVDESRVMGALTAMFGQSNQPTPPPSQRWQNAGQHSAPPPPSNAARDQAQEQLSKRFPNRAKP
jgi:hypothetical protein